MEAMFAQEAMAGFAELFKLMTLFTNGLYIGLGLLGFILIIKVIKAVRA